MTAPWLTLAAKRWSGGSVPPPSGRPSSPQRRPPQSVSSLPPGVMLSGHGSTGERALSTATWDPGSWAMTSVSATPFGCRASPSRPWEPASSTDRRIGPPPSSLTLATPRFESPRGAATE